MNNYPPGVSGSESHFYDPLEVMAFDVLAHLDGEQANGYTIKHEDLRECGEVVEAYLVGSSVPSVVMSVRKNVDHSDLIAALDRAHVEGTTIDGNVAVLCNAAIRDEDAASMLAAVIEAEVERIRNHDPREDHPDV